MKVLVIEDDRGVSDFIKERLAQDSFSVDTAYTATNGAFLARTVFYDVIILNHSMPHKDGVEICEEIRDAGIETPIIFLSIHHDTKSKILALDKGGDDYMTKPFAFEELRARLLALARRNPKRESSIITIDDLTLDTNKRTVVRDGTQIYLTRKTYELLEYLMRNKGKVLSRGLIMEYVWNSDSDPFSNTIEAHILNLRKKININGKKNLVKNLPGRGYIMED